MSDTTAPASIGVLVWNQYIDRPAMLQAGKRADVLGYDSLESLTRWPCQSA